MAQGSRAKSTSGTSATSRASKTNGHPLGVDLTDLDALLADIDVSPAPLKLAGRTWLIRRDLTAREVAQFWRIAERVETTEDGIAEQDAELHGLLLVDDVDAFTEVMHALPAAHMQAALRKAMITAGLVNGQGAPGK